MADSGLPAYGKDYMKAWYQDAEQFKSRLETAGSINVLANSTGIARSTLQNWKHKHGITDSPVERTAADTDLTKQLELVKLENSKLRQYANKAAKGDLESDRLLQRLEDKVSTFRPSWEPWELPEKTYDRSAQSLVLPYSDLHAAEVVSLEETQGINVYDWNVMENRCNEVIRSAVSHTDHFGFDISTVNVFMLGDMLSGNIHAELAMTNDRPLAEAVVDLAEFHVDWLLTLASAFDGSKIRVHGVPGNHPRAWVKPQAKRAQDNADWVFYKMLEIALKGNPRFEFNFPRGAFNVAMIEDRWRALLLHGDGIRSSMPGVPWGGVIRRVTTLETQFTHARQPLDYIFMGHFHQENQLGGVHTTTWVNGSVKGADEYSLRQYGQGRPAAQQLMTFHRKRGWTGSYSINLQERSPASEGWGA